MLGNIIQKYIIIYVVIIFKCIIIYVSIYIYPGTVSEMHRDDFIRQG